MLREFRERFLGRRESLRVASVAEMAAEKIASDQRDGRVVRDDEFFEAHDGHRPEAEELLEGVLLAAQREHEERKLPYYANFLANLAFERNVDAITANRLLRIADDLSYTQLVLLAVVETKRNLALPDNSKAGEVSRRSASVRAELDDLGYAAKELVLPQPRSDNRLPTNIGYPQDLILTTNGKAILELMGLSAIDQDDRLNAANALWDYSGLKAK